MGRLTGLQYYAYSGKIEYFGFRLHSDEAYKSFGKKHYDTHPPITKIDKKP